MVSKRAGLLSRKTLSSEVLFVTQHDSSQMMREALAAGARGYVVKSNLARDLVEAIVAVSLHREFTALAESETLLRFEGGRKLLASNPLKMFVEDLP